MRNQKGAKYIHSKPTNEQTKLQLHSEVKKQGKTDNFKKRTRLNKAMITRGQLFSELFRQYTVFGVFRKSVRIQIATRHWLRTAIGQTGMLLL